MMPGQAGPRILETRNQDAYRHMWSARRASLSAAAVLACAACLGQQQILFDRLRESDGLPGTEIYAILEDRQGMVWVGTEAGLARLEGTRTRVWRHDPRNPHSLSNQVVQDIAEDEHGRIWVATSHGFQYFRPERNDFQVFHVPKWESTKNGSDRVYQLVSDRHGTIWMVTDDGLWRFREDAERPEQVQPTNGPQQGLPPDRVNIGSSSLAYDAALNGLWVATSDGLCFFDPAADSWYGPGHDPKGWGCFRKANAQSPASDGAGGIWWYDRDSLALVHSDTRTGRSSRIRTIDGRPLDFTVQWMQVTRDGALWLSTWTHRFLRHDPGTGTWTEFAERADGGDPMRMRSTNVKSFLQDTHGTLWFGTFKGMDLVLPERQVLDLLPEAVPAGSGAISAMQAIGGDSVLIGTSSGLLFLRIGNGDALPVPAGKGLPLRGIHQISRRDPGRWWINGNPGSWCYDARTGAFGPWGDAPPGLQHASVTSMATTPNGDTWAGTWGRGLYVQRAIGGTVDYFHDTLTGNQQLPWRGCLVLMAMPNGDMLAGLNNSGGLCRFPAGKPPLVRYLDGQEGSTSSCGVVLALERAADGGIWAGTHAGGVAHVDLTTGMERQYTSADGLPSNRVNSILEDREGKLWALTDRGLAYLPAGASVFQAVPLPAGIDVRSISSGLARLADGRIAFAIGRMVVSFDPRRTGPSGHQPRSRFVRMSTADSVLWVLSDRKIRLDADQHAFTMEWGTDDPLRTRLASFAYRVLPDSQWVPLGHTGRVDINGLAPGKHRVEVRAGFDGLHWGVAATSPLIEVPPPFQDSWWFRALVALVVLAIGWLSLRLYIHRRLAVQRVAFEREQAVLTERMRIAGDMHDDLGAGLSALKLRSEMALRTEMDPAKREQLGALASTAGELIGSMRQIIWTMNRDQAGLEDLVVYVTSYARGYCAENGLELDVDAPGPWPVITLSTEQRRNVFLVVKEALHNILKHAQARQVGLQLAIGNGNLMVKITDDGVGMCEEASLNGGNGLRNMERRAAALGGSLSVEEGPGTVLRLTVPLVHTDN